MQTIKRTIGAVSAVAVSALVLMAGCVGDASEDGSNSDLQNSEDAVTGCSYPVHKGGGVITSMTGCFPWGGVGVQYKSKGEGETGRTVSTVAVKGNYEIVALSASHGGNEKTEIDTWFDSGKMTGQGFKPIVVRGSTDKKVELWVRQNNGQTTLNLPDKAVEYNILAINQNNVKLNLNAISKQTVYSGGDSFKVPSGSNSGMTILAYFGDDPDEVTNTGGGELLFNKWGFGDGDSLHVILYAPGASVPSTLSINNHSPGGRQWVGIRAHFPKL
jgi:hypothetical protein